LIQIPEILKRRGFMGSLNRFAQIMARYGITEKRIFRNLKDFSKLAESYGFRITIPITALTLNRHPNVLDILNPEAVELAVHGLKHIDYTKLSFEKVLEHIKIAMDIFEENGLNPIGFRAPYLKINETVLKAISEIGLRYDSSYPCLINELKFQKFSKGHETKEFLRKLYTNSVSEPNVLDIFGVKEFPVILPDDVIVVDELRLGLDEICELWIEIIKKNLEKDSVFVFQIHPERFHILKPVIEKIIEFCFKKDVKLNSLSELAEKVKFPSIAITGDIDIISIFDIPRVL